MLGHPPNNKMASTGYYKICPKCFRKYGRHFTWCIDCTPRAKPDLKGVFPYATANTRYGKVEWHKKVRLNFCCSKKLSLDKRIPICDKCRARFKCYTQSEDN